MKAGATTGFYPVLDAGLTQFCEAEWESGSYNKKAPNKIIECFK